MKQLHNQHTCPSALQTISKLLDGSQPKDIPGAIMVAQNAIGKAGPICASCLEDVPDPVCKALMLKGKPFIYLGTCARCQKEAVLALVQFNPASP